MAVERGWVTSKESDIYWASIKDTELRALRCLIVTPALSGISILQQRTLRSKRLSDMPKVTEPQDGNPGWSDSSACILSMPQKAEGLQVTPLIPTSGSSSKHRIEGLVLLPQETNF